MYHPNSALLSNSSLSDSPLPDSPLSDSYQPALKHSSIQHFLDCPDPPRRHPVINEQHSLRVLTSSENLKRVEEKEKEKQKKAREKEERAKMREIKKALKEQQKRQKQPKGKPRKNGPQGEVSSSSITFSQNEMTKFAHRFENGYDITTDERYNAWLGIFHPKTLLSCKFLGTMYFRQSTCSRARKCEGKEPVFHVHITSSFLPVITSQFLQSREMKTEWPVHQNNLSCVVKNGLGTIFSTRCNLGTRLLSCGEVWKPGRLLFKI